MFGLRWRLSAVEGGGTWIWITIGLKQASHEVGIHLVDWDVMDVVA